MTLFFKNFWNLYNLINQYQPNKSNNINFEINLGSYFNLDILKKFPEIKNAKNVEFIA